MLDALIGQVIVVDLRSPFVCIGELVGVDDLHLHLKDADIHDLRDTQSTREQYVVASRFTGVKRNRKSALVIRADVVAVSRLADVVED